MSLVIPTTAFERAAVRYIRHHRALGKQFDRDVWVLRRVARLLAEHGASDLDAGEFETWLRSRPRMGANSRRQHALVVRKFCLYRRRTEPDCFVPDPLYFPRRTPERSPVIFGAAEVARMLEVIDGWPPHPHWPLRQAAFRLAVILLYTTGLRRGELVRLTLADVDLRERRLTIRASKFHKTRIVPLSPSAGRALRSYLKERLATPWDITTNAPLFGHHHGSMRFRAYVGAAIGQTLHRVFREAQVFDPQGRVPRVHDFRHSFAVQALLRWYRAGVDVQAKLPQLSMYLGHVSIASTAHYLHFIPEIAAAAHRRFARHFGSLAQGGAR